ncbi:MAG: GrrA/OscA1 family cyclophane-containing rSAM-modified RiPP [Chitinophagaceae bacterium]|nr:GrrA/OscA1 family cyclophane-containing rSAM-modified RiPP [Chitinophagaceae bacterium]
MAFFSRSRLFGLLFLLTLPLDGAAALALAASSQQPSQPPVSSLSLEERLQRIGEAVQQLDPQASAEAAAEGVPDDALSYVFVNAPAAGWVNGGFRNGGFYNGGFRNGGFYNGGFRNGGFANGGFRNGGGWRNGGFRNGGFRNAW